MCGGQQLHRQVIIKSKTRFDDRFTTSTNVESVTKLAFDLRTD